MTFHTKRNTVILALVQIGVIVSGVLAAGANHKWHAMLAPRQNWAAEADLVADYGWLLMPVPLLWVIWVWRLQSRNDEPVIAGLWVAGTGFAIIGGLLYLFARHRPAVVDYYWQSLIY
jgi:hypothetical protein